MFAVFVNTIGIILGSLAGCCFRRGISKEMNYVLMQALGLCVVVIGIQGAIKEDNILIMIISAVTGVFIGQYVDADGLVNKFTARIMSRFAKGEGDTAKLVNAFVTSCLIMNVGAMVIVGSLDAGLREDYTMLYTKSLLDTIAGVMMTAAMGIGVMGSAFLPCFSRWHCIVGRAGGTLFVRLCYTGNILYWLFDYSSFRNKHAGIDKHKSNKLLAGSCHGAFGN